MRVFEIRAEIFSDLLPEVEFYKSPPLDFRKFQDPDEDKLHHVLQFIPQDRLLHFFPPKCSRGGLSVCGYVVLCGVDTSNSGFDF